MDDFESFLRDNVSKAPGASPLAPPPAAPAMQAPMGQPAGGGFEAFLQQAKGAMHEQTLEQAQTTAVVNSSQSADTAAAAAKVAPKVGLPQAVIETDLPRYQAQAKAQENSALLAQNPVLARWVASNPDSARVAQDEYDKLSTVEKMWSRTKEDTALASRAIQGVGASFWKPFALAGGSIPSIYGYATGNYNPADAYFRGVVQPIEDTIENAQREYKALPNGKWGVVEGPAANQRFDQKAVSTAANLVGVLAQAYATSGESVGVSAASSIGQTLAATGKTAAQAMAFPSLSSAVQTGQQTYAATGDAATATNAALASYLFTTAQGAIPMSAPGSLLKRLGSGAASSIATSETQREAMNLLLPPEMRQKFDPQDMVFQAITGAILGGVMGPRSDVNVWRSVRQTYTDAHNAEIANRDIGKIAALGQIAAESKLRDSSPDAFHEFVRTVTDRSDLDAVWVSGRALSEAFAQSKIDIEKLPGLREQMGEAVATGGDVRIPVADFATHIAGTDLEKSILPELKAAPDGMTYREGQAFYQDATKQLTERAQKLAEERQATGQVDADRDAVRQTVLDQLNATKRNPESVNKAYANMVSEVYATMAQRAGMKPSELFKKAPLKVAAEPIESAQQLHQGRYTPEEVEFFKSQGIEVAHEQGHVQEEAATATGGGRADEERGRNLAGQPGPAGWREATLASVGGRDDRQPAVIYRGSPDGRTSASNFDAGELGKSTGHPSAGLGVWFSTHSDDAASYGRVGEYHLDIRNPKVFKTDSVPSFESASAAAKFAAQLKAQGHDAIAFDFRDVGGPIQYAVFEPHQVYARDTFKQDQRGAYDPLTRSIALLKDADLSTFLHESGHHFLEVMHEMAAGENAPESIKADFDILLQSFGEAGKTPEERLANWSAKDIEGKRGGHEKFASQFERYLMEGKAPTQALQPLFARFRSWLLNIYRTLSGAGAELSPEVRGVMDRLVASEDAIRETEHSRGFAPLFADAKAAKMDDKAFAEYQALGQKATDDAISDMSARSMRDMKWLSGAKSKALKALQREAAEARKTVRAEVEAELDASPAEQARKFLRDHAKDRAGSSDLEMVAAMHGFTDAGEMRLAIDALGNRKDLVQAMTDQRMLERHGELTDPQSIEAAANMAVHNEARARFMATGLKALTDSPLPANQIAKAAKEAAESAIAMKRIADLRPDLYLTAETRANREAIKAAAKDPAAAIEAQRAAVLNNRLARAAQDAKDDVAAGLKYLKKFDKASIGGKVGAEYMDRINELLSAYDVTSRYAGRSNTETRMQMREWLNAEYDRTGVMPEVSDGLMNFAQKRHWSELRVEEFRGLVDAVKSLEHVGREQTAVTLEGQRIEVDKWVEEAKASMSTLPHTEPVDVQPHLLHASGLDKVNAKYLATKGKVRSMDAALLKMEQIFQMLDAGNRAGLGDTAFGAFSKVFTRMAKAEGAERAMRAESVKDLRALGDQLREAKVDLNERLSIPELTRQGRGAEWYREELLAAALNTGNAANLKKLAKGYGWQEAAVLAAIDARLSKPERDFVQGVWNAIGKYGPQIEALQKRLTGVAPEMVKAQALRTQHGDYEGGYYPLVYDAFLDTGIDAKNERAAAQLFENNFAKPATNKGHTIERSGYVGPIALSLGVVARHIDQVTHDLAWREAIIDGNKLLTDPRIKVEVDQTMGREYTKQMRPWLQAMANDKVFNTTGDTGWENFYRKARANGTMVGLGFRLSTMQLHGLSALSTSIGEVGTKWMAKGAAQFATPERWRNAVDFVFERSPEMANRMNEMDRNVHEAIDDINRHSAEFGTRTVAQKAVDGARKFAFYGVSMLDMASAMPTWYAAYLKGMSHEGQGGLGMSEEAAIEYANRAVRNAHGGGGVKDLAAVQRDKGAMSLATMFYSFWNHMYNRQRDLMKGWGNLPESMKQGTGTRDFSKLLARSWWYFVVPQLIHALIKPSPDEGKDDSLGNAPGSLGHFLFHTAKEIGVGFVSGVPVLRDLANAAVNGRDYAISPLEQAGKSLVLAATDAYKAATGQETSKHPVKNAAQAAGYTFGLPTGQASSSAQFLWDVYNGDADPQSVKDWYDGLSHGRITQ
jgi:Large polyvalent protein associated domain 22